jgi:inositol oxygenase
MKTNFRNYTNSDRQELVEQTYKKMYIEQTLQKKLNTKIYPFSDKKYKIIDILPLFDKITDDSDPDCSDGQIVHLLQTYISMKQKFNKNMNIKDLFTENEYNNLPIEIKKKYDEKKIIQNLYPHIDDWNFIYLIAFLHDIGKIMLDKNFHNLPQHFSVGDIYPLGIQFSKSNIFYDKKWHELNPEYGIYNNKYENNCGFDKLDFTISHDYYLYKVLENTLIPKEGLYIIRFHSFYAWHSPRNFIRGYTEYSNENDWINLPLLKIFQKSDLYSKTRDIPKFEDYQGDIYHLINRYCGDELIW